MNFGSPFAVILVNYKGYARQHLAECYQSLMRQDLPLPDGALFIVDNASTEESRRELTLLAPRARILPDRDNLGWAGGNNVALRSALAEGARYLITLNMDTRPERDWLRHLVEAADRNPALHILQSKLLLYGTDRINSLGGRIQYLGYGYCNGYDEIHPTPQAAVIDFASGAAMLVKREVFERIGLLRDEYFMYCEDMEFCWRARLAGFNVGLADQAVCHHKHDPVKTLHSLRYVERNRWLSLLTLEKGTTLLALAPCLLVSEIFLFLFVLGRGRADIPVKLFLYFLRPGTWRWIAACRRQVGQIRRRSDRAIVGQFAGALFVSKAHPFLRALMNGLFNPLLTLYWTLAKRLILW